MCLSSQRKNTAMTPEELYMRCDEQLLTLLGSAGFTKRQPGEYVRETEEGTDRILISHGPGAKKHTHFCIGVGFRPACMEVMKELIALEQEDEGFLVGPYLNPVSVTSRPKYWGYRTHAALDRSLGHAVECLESVGLPWLESLRDAKTFAENVDPVAALPAGIANEVAGNTARALEFYGEMNRRIQLILDDSKSEKDFLAKFGKAYVFVTAKLGVDEERRQAFERKLDYHPDVKPLHA